MSTQAAPASAQAKTLIMQLSFSHSVFKQNTAAITDEEALQSPPKAGNCMNWIGGHLLGSRNGIMGLLGIDPVLAPDVAEQYKRGSDAIGDADAPLKWSEIVELWDESQDPVIAALAKLTEEDLAKPLPSEANPFDLENVGEMIGVFAFHEAYHVGQLGLLRRIYGKEAAIK